MIVHLSELFTYANEIPMLNQVEFNPYVNNKKLLNFCSNNNILLEAYSPLTRMKKTDDTSLLSIAKKYSKTAAQILIRWALEHNLVVIPKSANKNRIIENANVFDFELDESDMKFLDNLNEDFRVSWDPTTID